MSSPKDRPFTRDRSRGTKLDSEGDLDRQHREAKNSDHQTDRHQASAIKTGVSRWSKSRAMSEDVVVLTHQCL